MINEIWNMIQLFPKFSFKVLNTKHNQSLKSNIWQQIIKEEVNFLLSLPKQKEGKIVCIVDSLELNMQNYFFSFYFVSESIIVMSIILCGYHHAINQLSTSFRSLNFKQTKNTLVVALQKNENLNTVQIISVISTSNYS